MNLTYLAVTGGIVLATMLVYALLSWRRAPEEQHADESSHVTAEVVATEPSPRRKRRAADNRKPAPALTSKHSSSKPRRDPS